MAKPRSLRPSFQESQSTGALAGGTRAGVGRQPGCRGPLTTRVSSRLSEPDPSHTLEERVVHWYFKLLDKNSSGDIGKKEIKPFKRFLRKKSKPKKCVKKFVEYCDVNNDKSISLQELMGCLGVTREEGETNTRKRHSKSLSHYFAPTRVHSRRRLFRLKM